MLGLLDFLFPDDTDDSVQYFTVVVVPDESSESKPFHPCIRSVQVEPSASIVFHLLRIRAVGPLAR